MYILIVNTQMKDQDSSLMQAGSALTPGGLSHKIADGE
jgi:hypothetical protein